jgi:hypothetical protein
VNPATVQFIGLQRLDIPESARTLSGLQGAWFALPDPSLSAQFGARYQAAYGSPPHPIAGLGYDAIAAIGALVSQGQSNALTGQALTQPSGFAGVERGVPAPAQRHERTRTCRRPDPEQPGDRD